MISIVIPTCTPELLKTCINSIKEYSDISDIEIIVIANGCDPQEVETYLKSVTGFKNITPMYFGNMIGFSRAINLGIERASGEYILLLNDDVILLPQEKNVWLDQLLKPFKDDPDMGITGALELLCDVTRQPFVLFFCALIKRTVIDKIGLLDTEFREGFGEDIEYCIRARANNFKVVCIGNENQTFDGKQYVSNYPLYHAGGKTFNSLPNSQEIVARNKQILKDKFVAE